MNITNISNFISLNQELNRSNKNYELEILRLEKFKLELITEKVNHTKAISQLNNCHTLIQQMEDKRDELTKEIEFEENAIGNFFKEYPELNNTITVTILQNDFYKIYLDQQSKIHYTKIA